MPTPLKLIVIAAQPSPRVRDGWRDLEPAVRAEERIKLVAVDDGGGLDFNRRKADLVVVLGGDGAILRACRQMGSKQLPILGVNLGRLGFLADLSPDEFRDNLPGIAARKFRVVGHLMYECELVRRGAATQRFLGLNEVAVSSAAAMRMIDVHLTVDDEPVTIYSGDGVIVSTPVGSTAHNLSAGGPILRQDLQAFVITPICPHTLTNRPLVDSADCVFTLSLPDIPRGAMLIIDGQVKQPLEAGDVVNIRRAPVTFQLAKIPQHSYYGTLHRKLGWGGQPNYQRSEVRGQKSEVNGQ